MLKIFKSKKLILVLGTFTLVINISKKTQKVVLDLITYMHYLVHFWKNKDKINIKILITFSLKFKGMTILYATQLGLKIWLTYKKLMVYCLKLLKYLLLVFK